MSTDTTTTTTDPRAALVDVIDTVRKGGAADAAATLARIVEAAGTTSSGTMREWMRTHDGQRIDTLQVGLERRSAWAPLARPVDASRATLVTLDGSRRDYAGCRVIAASADGLIVADEHHVIAYAVSVTA